VAHTLPNMSTTSAASTSLVRPGAPAAGPRVPVAVQASFDELGRPLREVTFCVVDLETTGGSATAGSMITEIGAVKVRGGDVLGEFQTLVNPQQAIPPFIAVLTGISPLVASWWRTTRRSTSASCATSRRRWATAGLTSRWWTPLG
jgi:DNA polymerase-3 subunit epsilon